MSYLDLAIFASSALSLSNCIAKAFLFNSRSNSSSRSINAWASGLLISSSPILDLFFVLFYFSWVCVILFFFPELFWVFCFSWCSSKYNLEKKTKSFKGDFWKIAKKVVRHQAWRNMLGLDGYISLKPRYKYNTLSNDLRCKKKTGTIIIFPRLYP